MLTADQRDFVIGSPLNGKRNRLDLCIRVAGIKARDVATALQTTDITISEIRNGKYDRLLLERAREIAGYFGLPIEVMFPADDAQEQEVSQCA